jgi:predicted alpha-1,2-mannosidase
MIKSMLAHYDQSVHKMLPIWSHYANENWCMIGYHAVSVIADAIAKDNAYFNLDKALTASLNTSTVGYFDGLDSYMKSGFVAEDKSSSSASKTLEYAYDDWCIARIAKKCGDQENYDVYLKRSENYNNVYDPSTGFMRPRLSDGQWKSPFDPLDTHGQGFIEGNAWTYSLFVPHQVEKMISLSGGEKRFIQHLDSLFSMKLENKYIEKNEDITRDGLIGNYVHGNEPGHHIPYLYNWTSKPRKTQERVRMIMSTMYGNKADGLCGNDDAGQMSAWYVFSALGFYPVTPGTDRYEIGSPLIKSAIITLENGKVLNIVATHQKKENVYVKKILVNGAEIKRHYLLHKEIMDGGKIEFVMGAR